MSDSGPDPAFVDTNVLVYAATSGDVRSAAAQLLVRELMLREALRTSTQVLQEFFVVVTRKIKVRLTNEQALEFLDTWSECPVVLLDYPAIREAGKLTANRQLSFWDTLILVAARRSGAKRIYTEDLQDGQVILGVQVVNPFRSGIAP
jgi:predicted nucleic acid-binding protein